MERITISPSPKLGNAEVDSTMNLLGKVKSYSVYLYKRNSNERHVVLLDTTKPKKSAGLNVSGKIVGEIFLTRSYAGKAWRCSYTRIDKEYQGCGISIPFYKFLLRRGYILEAGHAQSIGGRFIWWKLAKERDVIMIAKEKYSREGWVSPERDNKKRELRSDFFDIYDGLKDVNVYAYMCVV